LPTIRAGGQEARQRALHLICPFSNMVSYAAGLSNQNQAIRLHEANRTTTYIVTSAKMAPVWADRESASCGLNTKQASGCNHETVYSVCTVALSWRLGQQHAQNIVLHKSHSTEQDDASCPLQYSSACMRPGRECFVQRFHWLSRYL
jgi:hypothetical protein